MDLPESYKGETWLKPVEETKPLAPPLKSEMIETVQNPVEIPLSGRKSRVRKVK